MPDENDVDFTFTSVSVFEKGVSKLKEPEYEKLINDQAIVHLAKEVVEYLK